MRLAMVTIGLGLVLLTSCARTPEPHGSFQLVTAKDGRLLRLDSETGDVYLVEQQGLVRLSDHTPILQIGEYYEMADAKDKAKFLKYLGNGRFEKSEWAIKEITK